MDAHSRQPADINFDAEVGDLPPEEMYRLQQRAAALHIEQVQQQVQEICTTNPGIACHIALEQSNQRILGITLEAGLRPQTSLSPPMIETGVPLPTLSMGVGAHASVGIGGYGDAGAYIIAKDITEDGWHFQFQPYAGGGTTGAFGEVTPVIFISNAPLEKWPGWSVNVGGSVESGWSVGADMVQWKDEQGNHYGGLQLTLPFFGAGGSPEFALPIEFHGGASHTWEPLWRLKR